MTKTELKTGMVLVCTNGNKYLVVRDTCTPICGEVDLALNLNGGGYIDFSSITEDLKDTNGENEFVIVRVDRIKNFRYVFDKSFDAENFEALWERPKKKQYTYSQVKEILGEEFEIIKD